MNLCRIRLLLYTFRLLDLLSLPRPTQLDLCLIVGCARPLLLSTCVLLQLSSRIVHKGEGLLFASILVQHGQCVDDVLNMKDRASNPAD